MAVVPLTLAISLLLVVIFLVFFLREHSRGASSSPERDSLLPFNEEHPSDAPRNRTPRPNGDNLTTDHAATGREFNRHSSDSRGISPPPDPSLKIQDRESPGPRPVIADNHGR